MGFCESVFIHLLDVNQPTSQGNMTPLKLALQKCCDCLNENSSMNQFHEIAITLMGDDDDTATGADESVLRLAVNFPVILKKILNKHPEYCTPHGAYGLSALAVAIRSGLLEMYSNKGFIELALDRHADTIVMDLIKKNPIFLKTYKNAINETPLHTAAKLNEKSIAKSLMERGSQSVHLLNCVLMFSVNPYTKHLNFIKLRTYIANA